MRPIVRSTIGALAFLSIAAACDSQATLSPSASTAPTATASTTPTPLGASATPATSPSPTPLPPLSLEPPAERDERVVGLEVTPEIAADTGGRLLVTLRNLSDARIDEIVLRWPTELKATLWLAPFLPSADRIREGGNPLVQPWTRWVEGPGERGEPAGTTSLGYGPLDPGITFTIPVYVTRVAAGPVGFDLQILGGEALLTLESGRPADVRVNLP